MKAAKNLPKTGGSAPPKWHCLEEPAVLADATLSARVSVARDSAWFAGHFPAAPVLPGIAQLSMVVELVAWSRQEKLCIKKISRVKFKKLVRPEEELVILASAAETANDYVFKITSSMQDVCTGRLSLVAAP